MKKVLIDGLKGVLMLLVPCMGFILPCMGLKMGLQVEVNLVMNQLIYCSQPRNPFISFSLLGGCMSKMDLIFDRPISIPLSLTRKPSNFQVVTLNVHFYGFNLSLYSLIILKNFL